MHSRLEKNPNGNKKKRLVVEWTQCWRSRSDCRFWIAIFTRYFGDREGRRDDKRSDDTISQRQRVKLGKVLTSRQRVAFALIDNIIWVVLVLLRCLLPRYLYQQTAGKAKHSFWSLSIAVYRYLSLSMAIYRYISLQLSLSIAIYRCASLSIAMVIAIHRYPSLHIAVYRYISMFIAIYGIYRHL